MDEKPAPLSDLSFFKFPELTPEVVQSIGWLFVLLGVTVVATVIVHNWLQARAFARTHRTSFERISHESKQPKYVRNMLDRLVGLSAVRDAYSLTRDALTFETAVEQLYETAPEDSVQGDMDTVARIRRIHHLNVMNPALRLESTRQLLPDLPLRLVSSAGGGTLDVYCSLLDVNEAFMLVDLPPDEDIREVLRENPRVQLIYWREQDGETVFRTTLEFVPSETMPLVRAEHVFRSEDTSQRADFRLTVDFPLQWRYVERSKIGKIKAAPGQELDVRQGEGRMLDVSYGGAAFEAGGPLAPGGFAQLQFSIHKVPVHLMLEVMTQTRTPEGAWVHRGRIRGMTQEVRNRIFNYLSREQVARLRERGVIRRKRGEGEKAEEV